MKIAVIRISGRTRKNKEIEDTFKMLHLYKKFSCAIIEDCPSNLGMIKKLKDYVTYGPVSSEVLALLSKKGDKGEKSYRLHPPVGGFERKGTKKSFKEGGALGDRGEKINDLIKRMI